MPWVLDGITEPESQKIQELIWAGLHSPDVLRFAVQSAWVVDGLSDDERQVVAYLWMVTFKDEAVGRWLLGLPFIEEVTPENARGAAILVRTGLLGRPLAETVIETWWIVDGLDDREIAMVDSLHLIANKDQETALRILDMPFLTTIETSDMLAMRSLSRIRDIRQLMSHPILSEGITDTWAKRIAVVYEHSNARHILLDPAIELVTERRVTLPLTGEATIALISRSSKSEQVLDIMESAIRHHESFMMAPFPIDYIILVLEGPEFGAGGYSKETHIFLQREQRVNAYAIAHELAHFYWGYGGSFWVNEGAADLLAFSNLQLGHLNSLCTETRTIVELEQSSTRSAVPLLCSYSLGMRLFADLERSLGENKFRQGFRNLYLAQRDAGYWGVDQVVAAFEAVDNVPEGSVGRVFGRWYYGTHPYDEAVWDPQSVDERVPSVNGLISDAYVSATSGGPPAISMSGSGQSSRTAWLTLSIDYDVVQDAEVDIEIVKYFEDGFAYGSKLASFAVDANRTSMEVEIPFVVDLKGGQHGIYVYIEGRKVAQVEFDVTR